MLISVEFVSKYSKNEIRHAGDIITSSDCVKRDPDQASAGASRRYLVCAEPQETGLFEGNLLSQRGSNGL